MYRLVVLVVALIAVCAPAQSSTETLPEPSGKVILTVTGKLARTNRPGAADFDVDMLARLPLATVRTETPWTEGPQLFEGVLVRDLLRFLGGTASVVGAVALNDYKTEIPVSDLSATQVIIAYRHNGQAMAVRNKGPLWVIYPADSGLPDTNKKMIWQLRALELR